MSRRRKTDLAVLALATLTLFAGFYANSWKAADETLFWRHQRHSQSLVMARLVKSRQDGVFASAALLGRFTPTDGEVDRISFQYLAYERDEIVHDYRPYKSHPGGQAILYAVVDRALGSLSGLLRFHILQALAALTTAIVLAAFFLWLKVEFGMTVFAVVLITSLYSKWLTVFGRNLYWLTGIFFLPMLVMCWTLRRTHNGKAPASLFWNSFWPMLIKCLITGFEFITTTVLMMTVPIVYYALSHRRSMVRTLSNLAVAGAGAAAAVLITLLVLGSQIAIYDGDLKAAARHILVYTLAKRTYGNPDEFTNPAIKKSLSADPLDVLKPYLHRAAMSIETSVGSVDSLGRRIRVNYISLVYVFAACSLLLFGIAMLRRWESRMTELEAGRVSGLLIATWWSALAPLSWFLMFKGHSAIHTHVNFIAWHMPFILWGFALVGLGIKSLTEELFRVSRSQIRRSRDV